MNRKYTTLQISLLFCLFALPAFSQPSTIEQTSDTVTIYNDWIHVNVTKVADFVAPGSITGVYDRRTDQELTENFVNVRWLDLFVEVVHGNGQTGIAIPDTMRLAGRGTNWFALRAGRFVDEDTGRLVPLNLKMTVRLVRNRIYVTYDFFANREITLANSIMTASFLNPAIFETVASYNWSRDNHRNPVKRLNGEKNLTFDTVIQPTNQVRFDGTYGTADFHSPDTGMDHAVISKTDDNWVLFNQFTPLGESCCGDAMEQVIKAKTRFTRTVAMLVNNTEYVDFFERSGLPSATFSPIPNGGTNVMVNMVDDLPTLTFNSGDYYTVYDENNPTGADIDQFYAFLDEFPAVSMDLNLIFDSMLTVTQAVADGRMNPDNTDFIVEDGAGENQIWKFHNADKNIARTAPLDYHTWLTTMQTDDLGVNGRTGLVNRSYHLLRLEDVDLNEFETDPGGIAQEITNAYVTNVLNALEDDAETIGITVPKVYIAPGFCFDDTILEPLIKIGTESAVFCIRRQHAHPVFTSEGPIFAMYYNWFPTMNKARFNLLSMMRTGWPVIGLGEYFNGNQSRYNKIASIFRRAAQLFPYTTFMLAEDYSRFVSERHNVAWVSEAFNTSNGELLVTFKGRNSGGLSVVVNVDPRTSRIAGVKLDGEDFEDYRIDRGMLYITLPEFEQGLHKLTVDLF